MSILRTIEQVQAGDVELVGGKGLSLGLMAGAGLPVPPGFCVTTAAYRRLSGRPLDSDVTLREQIGAAYRQLGGGPVAVRSSATAEDGSVTSFAGQQETILGVRGEADVCAAVARCWESLHSERAVAYRRHQGVGDDGLAMAVVVQRLVSAEVRRRPLHARSARRRGATHARRGVVGAGRKRRLRPSRRRIAITSTATPAASSSSTSPTKRCR